MSRDLVRGQVCRFCDNFGRVVARGLCASYGVAVPRRLRPEIPGCFFHIFARGNVQAALFRDERDYEAWLQMLARTVERFPWNCHAYCAMPNHFHLLIETPEPTRSTGMRHLSGSYAVRFNERYAGSGHVFQGRYGAKPIVGEPQFLETCRYIVLNPVRAGVRDAPERWRWSSYRATAGFVPPPAFLEIDTVLGAFGEDLQRARRRYRQFVAEGQVQGPGPGTVQRVTHASRA
jgi:putative transposase